FSAGFMKDPPAQGTAVSSPPNEQVFAMERIRPIGGKTAPLGSKEGRFGNRLSLVSRMFGSSHLAFGHPGAGGSHAFADPEHHISFAYVMNQMEPSLLPNEKSLRLVDAIYSEGLAAVSPAG